MPSCYLVDQPGRGASLGEQAGLGECVTARSVPGELTDATVRTSTSVASGTGRGLFSTSTGAPASGCTIYFMW